MRHIVVIASLLILVGCTVSKQDNYVKTDIPDNCWGNTQAAPCNVVIQNGQIVEWTTNRGD